MAQPTAVRNVRTPLPRKAAGGFTIVELLVAAVITLIAVAAVVAVARQSVELQATDSHRRQARTIIMSVFETDFGFNMFNDAGQYALPALEQSKNVTVGLIEANGTPSALIPIPLGGDGSANQLQANMTITVTPDVQTLWGQNVPVHIVTIALDWGNGAAADRRIEMNKRLARWQND